MSTIKKLIVINLVIVVISLLILYPIYLFYFKNNPGNYIGILLVFAFILLRPRAKIAKHQSDNKVQIKWFGKIWEV
jgi:hypothetical protein